MRRLLLLPALLLAALPALAQGTLDVRVCVGDADDGAPVEGAWVRAREGDGPAAEGSTDVNGCAQLAVPVVLANEGGAGGGAGFAAGPAFPNPAASEARVPLRLGRAQPVSWRLYDLYGRLVREGSAAALPAGQHALALPLAGLPAGRYLYRIAAGADAATGTVVKAQGGTPSAEAPRAALTAAARLLFEAGRAGYDTLVTEEEVAAGATVTVALVKGRGPGRPLVDMAPGETYLGFEGGLYPGGGDAAPSAHHLEGVARGAAVAPLDPTGTPDPDGRYVLLSIGFSNTTQEFCGEDLSGGPPCAPWSFVGQALADPDVDKTALAIVDGARGGLPVSAWTSAGGGEYDRIRDAVLGPKGLSEAQVQVVWLKVANPAPAVSLPGEDAEAFRLVGQYGAILRALRARYPNLRQVFFSSRNWGGYATTVLHPEPFAYESGYAVKWAIGAQIAQMDGAGVDPRAGDLDYTTVAPWAAWGPYLWAEGLRPRADGLFWEPEHFEPDGTHPARSGEEAVGALLLAFFKASPYTRCWFVDGGTCGE